VAMDGAQPPLDSTQALVSRARVGDRAALEIIAHRCQRAMLSFAHGRMPRSARGLVDTVDVVQVALMRTLGRLEHIDTTMPGSLLAYVRRAVLNQIRDEIRRALRRPVVVELDDQVPARDRDPLETLITEEDLQRYERALLELPADQQQAFLMRMEMDFSFREIADALGRPSAEAARMLVRRALRAVTEALREPALQ
jgi:RNA polymerase sigma factor (sigma-70 family)